MNKTLTNKELVSIFNQLVEFIAKDKVAPGRVSYMITKNYKAVDAAIEPLKLEQQKISKKIEEANTSDMSDEEKSKLISELNSAFDEVLSAEVELNVRTISESDIESFSDMSVKDYLALDFMIEDENVPKSEPAIPTPVE